MLLKNSPAIWTADCEKAFEKLKASITQAPVLAFPDLKKPFKLYCDASAEAVGAVLTQENDRGEEHPLGYFSKALSPVQKNYNNTDKEIAAVKLAIENFRPFLFGGKVTIFSDNTAACHLSSRANPT